MKLWPLLALLGSGCEKPSQIDTHRSLVLDEAVAWPLPSLADLGGAFALPGGRSLAWYRDGTLLWFDTTGPEWESMVMGRRIRAVTPRTDQPIEELLFVTEPDGNLFEVRLDREVTWLRGGCPPLAEGVAFASVGTAIVTVVPASEPGAFEVRSHRVAGGGCEAGGAVRITCGIGHPSLAAGGERSTMLACPDPRRPLQWVNLDEQGLSLEEVRDSPIDPPDPEAMGLWFGLQLVALDDGYLRVLADLRSDERRLDRWSRDGRYVSGTGIREPIGLAAALPSERALLAVKGHPNPALRRYRWHWAPE